MPGGGAGSAEGLAGHVRLESLLDPLQTGSGQ